MLVPGVSKIAVLRANALGDLVVTLPALLALRQAYPGAEIVLLGHAWHADFLAERPGPIDRVEVIPPARGVGQANDYVEDPEELDSFFARMQQERFDLALQLHGGGKFSNPFVRRLKARVTAGSCTPDAERLDRSIAYSDRQHELTRLLEVVSLVGAACQQLPPVLNVVSHDLAEACQALADVPLPQKLCVLHPGAADPRRRWPTARFAEVGDALASSGMAVAVVGGDADRPLGAQIRACMKYPLIDLCGRLSLCGLTGLLSRARLLVGNDSGPVHLAEAVGCPTVRVYWCGNVATYGPLFQNRHRVAVAWRVHCPQCGRHCIDDPCAHRDLSFVADVAVAEVLAHVRQLVGGED